MGMLKLVIAEDEDIIRMGLVQTIDCKLGCRITATCSLTVVTYYGTCVYDDTASLFLHYFSSDARAGIYCADVDVENLVEVFVFVVKEGVVVGNAGVIGKDVNASVLFLY